MLKSCLDFDILVFIVAPITIQANSDLATCGERCVDMHAFQAATTPDESEDDLGYTIPEGRYFVCNNTIPQVADDTNPDLDATYMTSDLTARMLAGTLGWSDLPPAFEDTAEFAVYTNSSRISFGGQPIDTDMASLISSFTMGAISFMDSSYAMPRLNVTSNEQPVVAQVLKVKWKFAGTILGIIPFIHLLTLSAVIKWANKAIIKDDSHLAIAKVYHNFMAQMGDRGCLLRGDEIVAALENPAVAYGWRQSVEPDGADLMHVDIFDRARDMPREERPVSSPKTFAGLTRVFFSHVIPPYVLETNNRIVSRRLVQRQERTRLCHPGCLRKSDFAEAISRF